jgi:hypothetical protein
MAAARVTSVATHRFWNLFYALPANVQALAVKSYRLWQRDPHHPSLHFRRLQGSADRFTVRIADHYRVLGTLIADKMTWVWIGTHADYDRLVDS